MKIDEAIQSKFRNNKQRLAVNLMYTAHWYEAQLFQVFKKQDVTSQQYNILRIIKGADPKPVSISYIKQRIIETKSDVSRVVEKLRKKQMIAVSQSNQDKRSLCITITDEGKETCDRIEKLIIPSESVFERLNDWEIETMSHWLDKLRG